LSGGAGRLLRTGTVELMPVDSVDVTEPIGAEVPDTSSQRSDARDSGTSSRGGRRPGTTAIVLSVLALVAVAARAWAIGRYPLTFDESFTAMASRRSVDSLLPFLRHHDAHPPLDYLLRKPLAGAGVTNGWFRAPSVLCSIAAFAVFAVWMHRRAVMGLLAIAFMAVAPFELFYGREARMYSAVVLIGVVCAAAADRWLRRPDRMALISVSIALLVGLFVSTPVAFLAFGLFTLPMLRRDADAWKWRAAVAAPVVVWAATWGPSMIDQWRAETASWISYTTPGSMVHVVGGLVVADVYMVGIELLLTAGVLLGGLVLWRSDRRLAQVWIACFIIPLALAAGVGLVSHSFLPRTLAFAAWAPLVALAAVVDAAVRRWRLLGIASLLIIIELVAGPGAAAVAATEESGALHRVDRLALSGDAVGITPQWLRPLIDWNLGVHGPGVRPRLPNSFLRARDGYAFVLGPAPWDGRLWLIEPISYNNDVSGVPRCAPDWHDDVYRVFCLEPGRRR
jgi:hypothetical protein